MAEIRNSAQNHSDIISESEEELTQSQDLGSISDSEEDKSISVNLSLSGSQNTYDLTSDEENDKNVGSGQPIKNSFKKNARKYRLPVVESEDDSDSDDYTSVQSKNTSFHETSVKSDSEDNTDTEVFNPVVKKLNIIKDSDEENEVIISNNNSFKKSPKLRSIIKSDSEDDMPNISSQLEKSRISNEFRLGKNNLLSSTLIDLKCNTPRNPDSGKRLLNKSVDTPKTFKQLKENTPRQTTQLILSSSEESDRESEDVIDISDEEPLPSKSPVKVIKHEKNPNEQKHPMETIEVSQGEYEEQAKKIRQIQSDFEISSGLVKKINLEHLPDKGESLKKRLNYLEQAHLSEVMKLSQMKVTIETNPKKVAPSKNNIVSWNEIEAGASNVLPRTFGKQAMATIGTERQLTMDRLQQLHGSLNSCPKETDLAEPPEGLKVELMNHQKQALAWLMWREKQKPSGGILADDMGLGKTLTMISLMLKSNETENSDSEEDDDEENEPKKKQKFNGGTLVVCPASLINQWSGELQRRTKRGLASCELYHGAKRETKPRRLAEHDMVVTTYSIVNNECEKNGAIFRVKWRRIVIDEAHQIRNHKSQTSEAVCRLSGKSRWALTGTPVQNKELDMFALMKFLRCSPFDDLKVWKRWVGDKNSGGTERLHTVISSLMLRRTKVELMERGLLNALPERKWELISVNLTETERGVYSKILIFSRTMFAQFLHQRAEKNQDAIDLNYNMNSQNVNGPNQEYFLMRQKLLRLNKLRDIKQHEILVLLLRLRQICCHTSLITGMLQDDNNAELLGDDEEAADKGSALDLLDQLNKLTLTDGPDPDAGNVAGGLGEEPTSLKEVVKSVLSPSDPVFSRTRMSSKIKALIDLLKEKVMMTDDKAIIVSQWSSFLHLIAYHLKEQGFKYDQLDGKVPVPKRMEMVDRFNDPKDQMKILLLSLTAGGVGLNLIGANHLVLLDLHWNPQLENQAQDRIYRVGQAKPVFVYKFMAADTIEKRILDLQDKKLEIANSMLTGSKQTDKNKLTLQDLKTLFDM